MNLLFFSICFHKWPKWSEPKQRFVHKNMTDEIQGLIQTRTCEKCGKHVWKFVGQELD